MKLYLNAAYDVTATYIPGLIHVTIGDTTYTFDVRMENVKCLPDSITCRGLHCVIDGEFQLESISVYDKTRTYYKTTESAALALSEKEKVNLFLNADEIVIAAYTKDEESLHEMLPNQCKGELFYFDENKKEESILLSTIQIVYF